MRLVPALLLCACDSTGTAPVTPGPAPVTSASAAATPAPLLVAAAAGLEAIAAPTAAPVAPRVLEPGTLTSCSPHAFVPGAREPFTHKRSSLVVKAGKPAHSAQDILIVEGARAIVEAKIAYGAISKDLEDERVRAWIDTCEGWVSLGDGLTDSDGRARFPIERPVAPGRYPVRLEVAGDGSQARAELWVVARGTRLAVFDIDGTLTTSDEELLKDVRSELFDKLWGGYEPSLYPGAVAMTHATMGRGYVNLYLTGRPYWLSALTRDWMERSGVAPAVLHTTDTNAEAMTTESGVGEYKHLFLEKLMDTGVVVDIAHGNASTDVYAYLHAGIPPERVWIIGKHGGARGTHAVKSSWEPEVIRLRGLGKL